MRAPQACPGCGVWLADPNVPRRYRRKRVWREQFTIALEVVADPPPEGRRWLCPFCAHRWVDGDRPRQCR